MQRECEGARVTSVLVWGVEVWGMEVSCGECIADVLGMSVVHGLRGLGGVCEMCPCLYEV